MLPRLVLEVAPDQPFHAHIRKRFVAHLAPESIDHGTVANFSYVNPPGSNKGHGQYTYSDQEDITFSLLLNEFGASPQDLDAYAGHMNVDDSLRWLELAMKPIGKPKSKLYTAAPPILLLIFGQRPVLKVNLMFARVTVEMIDPTTAKTIRATVALGFKHHRKIAL